MNIEEFEKIEKLKKYFRRQLVNEFIDEIGKLTYTQDSNNPRLISTAESEDVGYHHGLSQVQKILDIKLLETI